MLLEGRSCRVGQGKLIPGGATARQLKQAVWSDDMRTTVAVVASAEDARALRATGICPIPIPSSFLSQGLYVVIHIHRTHHGPLHRRLLFSLDWSLLLCKRC